MKPLRIPAFDLSAALEAFSSLDEEPLRFGKHRGSTPLEIAKEDPTYIVWMYENIENKYCSEELYALCLLDHTPTQEKPLTGDLKFK